MPSTLNVQIRTGINPLWLCGSCHYTVVTYGEGACDRCKRGEGRPNLTLPDKPPKVNWKRS